MTPFIPRDMLADIRDHLVHKEMSVIIGPRQAGKTTLMNLLKRELEAAGEKTLFLNLDFEQDRPLFASQSALIGRMRLEFGSGRGYVFIDEIQRRPDAGLFLKGVYDQEVPYKMVISGSGSLELKEKIHESLAGRKRLFELGTVSLPEFINYRTGDRYRGRLREYVEAEQTRATDIVMEHLSFGGYPRVITADTLNEKTTVIDEIFRSYIERDIAYLLRVEKTDAFSHLLKILAGQTGGMVNTSELASTIGLSVQTVRSYLMYAEKTFVIRRVTPYFSNIRKEISKSPVVYFTDAGMRNYALGIFGRTSILSDMGFLFQNLVFDLLRTRWRYEGGSVHYWRTKDRAEIDFVVTTGAMTLPVEAKCRDLKTETISRPLRSFINSYKPREAWIVNLSFRREVTVEGTRVKFVPFYDLL